MRKQIEFAIDKIEGAIGNLDKAQNRVVIRLKDISKGAPGNEEYLDKCNEDFGGYIRQLEGTKSMLEGFLIVDEIEGDE